MSKQTPEEKMTIMSSSLRIAGLPASIPFRFLNEAMAQKNHGQSLEKLNSRGGMSVGEIAANMEGRRVLNDTVDDCEKIISLLNNDIQSELAQLKERNEKMVDELECTERVLKFFNDGIVWIHVNAGKITEDEIKQWTYNHMEMLTARIKCNASILAKNDKK